ncbi:MAG: Stage V sporulation protein S [uncultured Thermomicrobiales bacterium]|uniref:Stage V sporulation protein S n=1 Tax=uncultured Thermomicrobiales bacterium TaxID=1645740 RepID=A0A6J4UDH9_9BACT|nr:MAG: Stage V sporulation protein S [uncultured Thermomicrobiales bacterium]
MNRFFSKLDLRDIKIDPEGSRFPPDAEDVVEEHDDPPARPPFAETMTVDVAEPDAASHSAWPEIRHADMLEMPQEHVAPDAAALDHLNGAVHSVAHSHLALTGSDLEGEILKVSARSRPSAVAGAIAGVVREAGRAEVQAIGAGATNQAIKAVAIARDYLGETGIDAVCVPAFIDVTINNEDRTAIRLIVEPR